MGLGTDRLELAQTSAAACTLDEKVRGTVDAEIQAHLSSAHKRTAELRLVRVVLAASDP